MSDIQSQLENYLYHSGEPFHLFSQSHLISIVLTIVLLVSVPIIARKYFSPKSQLNFGIILAILIALNYPVWVILESLAGTFDSVKHLPFQLCRFANLLMPFILIFRNKKVYEILYYWGLSGVLQGLITPDITQDFPHFHYFRFMIGHHGMVLGVIYATVVFGMRPTLNGLKKAFIALNVFLIISIGVNVILEANYFWICSKPEYSTLLDYMGPWPWYIITGELVALGHFLLAYSPFYYINKLKNEERNYG